MIYDISYCQKGLLLTLLPNCEKVIIRIGIRDHEDTECRYFIKQCIKNNIPFEFYWYVMCTNVSEAAIECKYIIDIYNNLSNIYHARPRLWLDIEDYKQLQAFKNTFPIFVTKLRNATIPHGLYSFKASLQDPARIPINAAYMEDVPLWVAWWNTDQTKQSVKNLFPAAILWQTGKTKIGKNGTEVDTNVILDNVLLEKKNTINLYLSASDVNPRSICTNYNLWRYDSDIINGRVRVTNNSGNIGKLPIAKHVTGWVNLKELEVYENYKR